MDIFFRPQNLDIVTSMESLPVAHLHVSVDAAARHHTQGSVVDQGAVVDAVQAEERLGLETGKDRQDNSGTG